MFLLDMAPCRTSSCMDTLFNISNWAFEGIARQGHHYLLLLSLLTQAVKELPVCAHSRSEDTLQDRCLSSLHRTRNITQGCRKMVQQASFASTPPPRQSLFRFLSICFPDISLLQCPQKSFVLFVWVLLKALVSSKIY